MITSALPLAERSYGQFSRVVPHSSSGSGDMWRTRRLRKVQCHMFMNR